MKLLNPGAFITNYVMDLLLLLLLLQSDSSLDFCRPTAKGFEPATLMLERPKIVQLLKSFD
jgi:hypothetical protein